MPRYLYYLLAMLLYVVALGSHIYSEYDKKRHALYEFLDQELIKGAKAVPLLLEENFHEKLHNQNSVTYEEDKQNIQKLSDFVRSTRLGYIYSFILDGEIVRFGTSSATEEELKTAQGISHYFDPYKEVTPALLESFHQQKITFEETTDAWGTFRSVSVPLRTLQGKVFVVGADINIDFIDKELQQLVYHSLLEALFYILILCPFLLATWFVHKKENLQQEETIALRTKELAKKQEQMQILFNNADQGFLSFSHDLSIHHEFSKACERLLGADIQGKNIADLLFADETQRELFKETVRDLLEQKDSVAREFLVMLLPEEVLFNKKALKIEYKLLEDRKIMLILTNVTAQKKLENKIKKEQETLQMIVHIVSDSEIFYETKKGYEQFILSFRSYIDERRIPLSNFHEIYRMIHTFKGAFSQLYMQRMVHFLHHIESLLSAMKEENQLSNKRLLLFLATHDFKTPLEMELKVIEKILGEEFIEEMQYVRVNAKYLQELQDKVSAIINQKEQQWLQYKEIFDQILKLSRVKLMHLLRPYNNLVNQLAFKLGKEICEFKVVGDPMMTVSEKYKPFIKSLIHLFRNSVDHGIEDPETRIRRGKSEKGEILCRFERVENHSFAIHVSDDGAGIDREKVIAKAIQQGIVSEYGAKELSDTDVFGLLFTDGFSTKDEISTLSGRGIGMSVIKAEVDALGGSIVVKSEKNRGTTFTFTVPYEEIYMGNVLYKIINAMLKRSVDYLSYDVGIQARFGTLCFMEKSHAIMKKNSAMIKTLGMVEVVIAIGYDDALFSKLIEFFLQGEKPREEEMVELKESISCEIINTIVGNAIKNPSGDSEINITQPWYIDEMLSLYQEQNRVATATIHTAYGDMIIAIVNSKKDM